METLDLIQGTAEWKAARAKYFTASEAAAMLGISKYQTRSELLKQKHTGLAPEVDANKQALFDKGHAAEAAARPIVEDRIGEELFPATGVLEVEGLPLLASLDGTPMDESVTWENKLLNQSLIEAIKAGDLPDHIWPQLEQGLLVSGAKKAYFTTSDGTPENTHGCWYKSVPERRARLVAGWKQFAIDLANYRHIEIAEAPKAEAIAQLPVVVVSVSGSLSASNLATVVPRFDSFLSTVNKKLETDNDFANGEANAKFSRGTAKSLKAKAKEVVEQIADVSEAVRVLELYAEKFDALGLELEKLVKHRKESIRVEVITAATVKLSEYVNALNKRLGTPYMPRIAADFAGAVKNKRTIASLYDAVDLELARCKIEASEVADRIEINLADERLKSYAFLFADLAQICTKANDDFVNTVTARVTAHEAQEAAKAEAQRERIRTEELAKIERARRAAAEAAAITEAAQHKHLPAQADRMRANEKALEVLGVDGDHLKTTTTGYIDVAETGTVVIGAGVSGVTVTNLGSISNSRYDTVGNSSIGSNIHNASNEQIFRVLANAYRCTPEEAETRIRRINAPTYINLPQGESLNA